MKSYQISRGGYRLLKKLCQSEYFADVRDDVLFEDATDTVKTDKVFELMDQIDWEIFFEGLTPDKRDFTDYGEDLQSLRDELQYKEEKLQEREAREERDRKNLERLLKEKEMQKDQSNSCENSSILD